MTIPVRHYHEAVGVNFGGEAEMLIVGATMVQSGGEVDPGSSWVDVPHANEDGLSEELSAGDR